VDKSKVGKSGSEEVTIDGKPAVHVPCRQVWENTPLCPLALYPDAALLKDLMITRTSMGAEEHSLRGILPSPKEK